MRAGGPRARERRERSLRRRHHDARRETVSGHVRDDDRERPRVAGEVVEVAPDRGRGAEVDGDRHARKREARRRQEPPLQVARELQLPLEGLLLRARRDARREALDHVVEAPDERRELVVPLEGGAVREVSLLDLGKPDREPARRARDARDEEGREEGGEEEDDDRRDPEAPEDGEDDAAHLESLGARDPEVSEESPGLAFQGSPDEDEEGSAGERLAGLPVHDRVGQEQRECRPARGPRARARGRRRRLSRFRVLAARVGRVREALLPALLPGVESEMHAALRRVDGLFLQLERAEDANDVAGLLFELAAQARIEAQREDEDARRSRLDGRREDVAAGLRDSRKARGHPGLRSEVRRRGLPGRLDGPALRLPEHPDLGRQRRGRYRLGECPRAPAGVARGLEARHEVSCELGEGRLPPPEGRLDPAGAELACDHEHARVDEERREDDRGHQEEIGDDEPASHPPEEAAQERADDAHEEDRTRQQEDDDAERLPPALVPGGAHEEDARGRQDAADPKRPREPHRGAAGGIPAGEGGCSAFGSAA